MNGTPLGVSSGCKCTNLELWVSARDAVSNFECSFAPPTALAITVSIKLEPIIKTKVPGKCAHPAIGMSTVLDHWANQRKESLLPHRVSSLRSS